MQKRSTDPLRRVLTVPAAFLLATLSLTSLLGCSRGEQATAPPSASVAAPAAPPSAPAQPPTAAAATPGSATAPDGASPAAPNGAPAPVAAAGGPPVVVFLGDSLTAGLGLDADQAFPSLLSDRLAERGLPIRAMNAGVSGDTSAGGLRRLSWLLRQKPDVLVVELGANDALRGQPLAGIESNLRQVIEQGKAAGARVLLLGIRVPPNLGNDYAEGFAAIYPRVARDLDVPLVPFLLAGVAGDPALNQADGIHPNAEGAERVADVVLPHLEALLREPAGAVVAGR